MDKYSQQMVRPHCAICGKTIWSDYYQTTAIGPAHDQCEHAAKLLAAATQDRRGVQS